MLMKFLQRNFHLLPPSSKHNKHLHNPSKLLSTLPHRHKGPYTEAAHSNCGISLAVSPSAPQLSCTQETENGNMATKSHCFLGANTHLVVSDSQKIWRSAAQNSTFPMIAKSLAEEQILFQQDTIKESEPHKRNKGKGRLQQCSCGAGKQPTWFTITWVI